MIGLGQWSRHLSRTVVGIVAGGVLALGVSRLFQAVLVIVNTFDPAGYAFGSVVVLGVRGGGVGAVAPCGSG